MLSVAVEFMQETKIARAEDQPVFGPSHVLAPVIDDLQPHPLAVTDRASRGEAIPPHVMIGGFAAQNEVEKHALLVDRQNVHSSSSPPSLSRS